MAFQPRFWFLAALLGAGCTSATSDAPNPPGEPQTQHQSLGEATQAYWFSGTGAGPMPSYDERVAWSVLNQIRMNTDVFDIRDMNGDLIPPAPPMSLQPGIAEAGRWQGAHALEAACFCAPDMEGNPAPANAGISPFSCCTAGYVEGTIECLGPVVACGEEGTMAAQDRWGLLKRGPGTINNEIFFTTTDPAAATGVGAGNWLLQASLGAILGSRNNTGAAARTEVPLLPEECVPPEDTCDSGTCVGPGGETSCDPTSPDAPNECIGQCDRGPKAGEFCTIPAPLDPEICDPAQYPRGYHWSFLIGRTSEPTPFLNDVIHMSLAEGVNSVVANFYDPAGEPQVLQVVTDSACNDLTRTFERPVPGAEDEPLPYAGNTYQWDIAAGTTGCVRYIGYALDAEGFTHTFPTYGSLGMNIGPDGAILPNDETCPIWAGDQRPEPSCLPDGNECADGSTRLCYTGRPGTQGKGMCDVGTETCSDGRWKGLCEGETTPEAEDTCDDGADNNCNGFVDEGCPVDVEPPIEEPDAGTSGPDAGNETPDAGTDVGEPDAGTPDPGVDPDDGCCATANGSGADLHPLAVLLVGALLLGRRRRR